VPVLAEIAYPGTGSEIPTSALWTMSLPHANGKQAAPSTAGPGLGLKFCDCHLRGSGAVNGLDKDKPQVFDLGLM
jgi:hypothetical protein